MVHSDTNGVLDVAEQTDSHLDAAAATLARIGRISPNPALAGQV